MEKLVLIDGHSILNRAFYGVPNLTNSEGLHTNAVYGFLNILFKLLEDEKPQYLAVAFDVKAPTFRHNFYKEYNPSGWIFADYRNKIDETDKNTVIYGHNMKDKSMFGTLSKLLKSDYLNNNKKTCKRFNDMI